VPDLARIDDDIQVPEYPYPPPTLKKSGNNSNADSLVPELARIDKGMQVPEYPYPPPSLKTSDDNSNADSVTMQVDTESSSSSVCKIPLREYLGIVPQFQRSEACDEHAEFCHLCHLVHQSPLHLCSLVDQSPPTTTPMQIEMNVEETDVLGNKDVEETDVLDDKDGKIRHACPKPHCAGTLEQYPDIPGEVFCKPKKKKIEIFTSCCECCGAKFRHIDVLKQRLEHFMDLHGIEISEQDIDYFRCTPPSTDWRARGPKEEALFAWVLLEYQFHYEGHASSCFKVTSRTPKAIVCRFLFPRLTILLESFINNKGTAIIISSFYVILYLSTIIVYSMFICVENQQGNSNS